MALSEQFYKAIVKSSNDAIISKNLEGIITSWNPAAELIFGFTKREIIGQSVLTLFPPHKIDEEQAILAAIKRGDSVEHYRTQRCHKDGHIIDILVTVSPIIDAQGKICGASKIVKDISQQVKAETDLKQYQAIVNHSEDMIVSFDLRNMITRVNKSVHRLTGFSTEQLVNKPVDTLICLDDSVDFSVISTRIIQGESVAHFRCNIMDQSDHLIAVSISVSPVFNDHDAIIGGAIIARDIRDVLKSEQQLAHYQSLVHSSEDAIVSKSLDCEVTSWNKAAERLFGYKEEEIIGKPITLLFPAERLEEENKLIKSVRNGKPVRHFRTTRLHKNGTKIFVSVSLSAIYNDNNELCGFSKIVRDISHEIKHEQEVWHLANYDSLTGLLNRMGIQSCIEELAQLSQLRNRKFALFYLDLDGFKFYNDHFGHEFGDKLLVAVSENLRAAIRKSDEVGRIGGDEFVICMMGFEQIEDVKKSLQNIIAAVRRISRIDEVDVTLTASIGVSVFPDDGRTCKSLLSKADHAMYSAKEQGKDKFEFFSGALETSMREDNSLVRELRGAIIRNELELAYHPIICAKTQKVSKVEALVRWNHPNLGFIPPDTFIPIAEKFGLIQELDAWVSDKALAQLQRWTGLFGLDFQISLNKSPFELLDEDACVNDMLSKLHQYGTQSGNVVIEITEHALVSESVTAGNILRQYHELGLELAIDDFGTGYSSLSYLKYFPIKYLKLDKSFISSFLTNETDKALVEGVLAIAAKLGIKVVAEGVETKAQYERLLELSL